MIDIWAGWWACGAVVIWGPWFVQLILAGAGAIGVNFEARVVTVVDLEI